MFEYDSIVTIISFLIYKEWLLLSLENKQRKDNLNQMYFKSELQLRVEIYKLCKCIDQDHVDNLVETTYVNMFATLYIAHNTLFSNRVCAPDL